MNWFVVFVICLAIFFIGYNPSEKIDINLERDMGTSWQKAIEAQKPVIIYFHWNKCSSCKRIKPHIDSLARKYSSEYSYITVHYGNPESRALINAFNVDRYPRLYLYNPINNKSYRMPQDLDIETGLKKFIGIK